MKVYLKDLMILVNELIKKYAKSDDLGEYSKKKEMWDDIYNSYEIKDFLNSENSSKIFNKYSISKKDLEKKLKANSKNKEVNFKHISDTINIFCNTDLFYKKINSILWNQISDNDKIRLSKLSASIKQFEDLSEELIRFENNFIQKIRSNHPEVFDQLEIENDNLLKNTLYYIIKKYNSCIETNQDVVSFFEKIGFLAKSKGIKYESIFGEIGKKLKSGESPSVKQIYYASYYVDTIKNI